MSNESQYDQVRAIADEVLAGVKDISLHGWDDGRWYVLLDQINYDTAEVVERPLVSNMGEVLAPELIAKLGLTEQVEELVRRLLALGFAPEPQPPSARSQILAVAREVMKGSGMDAVVVQDDEGHLQAGVEVFIESRWRLEFRALASTRGDVPFPKLAEALGLRERAETLARRLGALAYTPTPLSEEEAALVPKALEQLWLGFTYGLRSLDDLAEATDHPSWYDLDEDRVRREVWRQLDAKVRARLDEEKQWPDILEVDRLAAAFEDLHRAGIVAEMGATNTLSSGWSLVRERAEELESRGESPWAAAFFHTQDLDHALTGGELNIAFGTLEGEELSDADGKVAEAIVTSLREHGFEPEWKGSVHSRVAVRPAFNWRRRRARVDVTEDIKVSPYRMGPSLVGLLPRARSMTLQVDSLLPYDLDQVQSDSLEEIILEFDSAALAQCLAEDVQTRVTGRFPKLRRLVLAASSERMAPIRIDL
ncbi:hypothetical protein A176_003749 [Myxococcus hansupus]|uniref:DUF6891 domain-containing protein n=1 Tax=Pseudomyxococcus hansupus TaxID=1297742 RepID=A0A0H4XF80_9BACT|nr:hypothetical protein [Myxococcus hansupus]AKQ66837.1 hypothetical protein A176_003749 [Myxococcus hansupus]